MDRGMITALPRRAALLILGAAGFAAQAPLSPTSARKRRGKKRTKDNANKLCKKQVAQCVGFFVPLCDDDAECVQIFDRCCARLGTCDFDSFFICIDAAGASPRSWSPPRR